VGISSQLTGMHKKKLRAAHTKQASRQPYRASMKALSGQPIVLANPAKSVIPVIGARAPAP